MQILARNVVLCVPCSAAALAPVQTFGDSWARYLFNTDQFGPGFLPLVHGTDKLSKSSHSQLHLQDPLARPRASVYPQGLVEASTGAQDLGRLSPIPEKSQQVGGRVLLTDGPPKRSSAGLSPPRRPQGYWPDTRGAQPAPLPSKIVAAGMESRGRERGVGAPPERVPTGVDLGAEDSPLLGQTGRTTIPTPPRGRGGIQYGFSPGDRRGDQ